MKIAKIRIEQSGPWLACKIADIGTSIMEDEPEEGGRYIVEIVEMGQDEFEHLPDFEGW